jgi:hypothetical protein
LTLAGPGGAGGAGGPGGGPAVGLGVDFAAELGPLTSDAQEELASGSRLDSSALGDADLQAKRMADDWQQ